MIAGITTSTRRLQSGGEGDLPTEPGTPYGGGFFAGRIMVEEQAYALVVAPKAQGEFSAKWKEENTNTGIFNRNDGWSNTQGMIESWPFHYHPAAEVCRSLVINGYNDWYIPSDDELELLYRAFKPTTDSNHTLTGTNPSAIPPTGNYTIDNPSQTNIEAFKYGGEEAFEIFSDYWSSTERNNNVSAWGKSFQIGTRRSTNKTTECLVRAVRRIVIKE